MKWLALSNSITKPISLTILLITATVKVLDIYGVYSVRNSHCIKGWQFDREIGRHFIFIVMTLIPDAVFVLTIVLAMPITSSNFGADPMTIAYNIMAAFMSLIAMICAIGLERCDNNAFNTINMMSTYALVAFILHILGAAFSLAFLAEEERKLPINIPKRTTTS